MNLRGFLTCSLNELFSQYNLPPFIHPRIHYLERLLLFFKELKCLMYNYGFHNTTYGCGRNGKVTLYIYIHSKLFYWYSDCQGLWWDGWGEVLCDIYYSIQIHLIKHYQKLANSPDGELPLLTKYKTERNYCRYLVVYSNKFGHRWRHTIVGKHTRRYNVHVR